METLQETKADTRVGFWYKTAEGYVVNLEAVGSLDGPLVRFDRSTIPRDYPSQLHFAAELNLPQSLEPWSVLAKLNHPGFGVVYARMEPGTVEFWGQERIARYRRKGEQVLALLGVRDKTPDEHALPY